MVISLVIGGDGDDEHHHDDNTKKEKEFVKTIIQSLNDDFSVKWRVFFNF